MPSAAQGDPIKINSRWQQQNKGIHVKSCTEIRCTVGTVNTQAQIFSPTKIENRKNTPLEKQK
jgi:hypothetical protein